MQDYLEELLDSGWVAQEKECVYTVECEFDSEDNFLDEYAEV